MSSGLGGTSIGATRYLVNAIDPLAIGSFRFGIGFALLLPVALLHGARWPARRDWPAVAGLGMLYFGLFPILFNASLIFTTAARGALALSTLPLLTMVVGAALGSEALTARKSLGVLIAMFGVAIALLSGLTSAPPGAWRGDLLMVGAALCMALYSIWSKPFIASSGPIPFTTMAMGVGAACLILISYGRGSFAGRCRLRNSAVASSYLSRRVRQRAHILSMGVRAGAHDADPRRDLRHRQSGDGVAGGCGTAPRAAWLESRRRHRDGVRRHLDRDDVRSTAEASNAAVLNSLD
jgi:drug/metabolite transporter (DMT)-like permease